MLNLAVLVDKHPIGIILHSNAVKGIRFQVNKIRWKSLLSNAAYGRLADIVIGEIQKWGGRSKEDNKITVAWETDGTESDELLSVILRRSAEFKLLPYNGGKSAPKAKGTASRQAYATAITTGPYAPEAPPEEESRQVEVSTARPTHAHTRGNRPRLLTLPVSPLVGGL